VALAGGGPRRCPAILAGDIDNPPPLRRYSSASVTDRRMNELSPTSRLADPIARARDLGPSIVAAANEIEWTQSIPEPLLSEMHAARICRMLLPRSVGGDQVEPWVYLRAVEEISRHDGSVGWNVFVANSAALIAPFIPLETARTIFADPRAVIAWGPPNQHRATAVSGGYRISGEWHFASGCRQATWMGAHGQVVEPDGSLRLNRFGRPTVRTLLFPKHHATPIHDWNTLGMRGTASEGYILNDLFVPEECTGTREDPALRRDTGPLYAFTMQGLYSVGVAAVAFGIARAMLDAFITLAENKAPRGLVRLADSPVVQSDVARREANLGAARAYLVEVLKDVWAAADDVAPIDLSARLRVRLGCAHAIHAAIEIADYVYKAAGTSAIFLGTPFERRFRDMHTLSQQIQSHDAHFETVGRIMFNGDPDETFL
jgi:alkylation response protein AidB-like acyl-CoA dehydrogenase